MYEAVPEAYKLREIIDQSEKPLVVMGIGIPGSGKSTIIKDAAWLGGPNSSVVNVDNIRNRFISLRAGRHLMEYIDQEVGQQVKDGLRAPGVAFVDAVNVERMRRMSDILRYKKAGAVAVGAVFMDVALDIAIQRNAQRPAPITPLCIRQMNATLQEQRPELHEGFDWIFTVGPNETTSISHV